MAVVNGHKRCCKCVRFLSVERFWPRTDSTQTRTDPYQPRCKTCSVIENKERRWSEQEKRDRKSDERLREDMLVGARRGSLNGKEFWV